MLFKIHRPLPYGTSLFLTGSTDALSKWSVDNAVPCKWTHGDIWVATIDAFNTPTPTRFEFKFFSRCAHSGDTHWESGDNHSVAINGVSSSSSSLSGGTDDMQVTINWSTPHETILSSKSTSTSTSTSSTIATFRIRYALADGEKLYIVGSLPTLGKWNKVHSPLLLPHPTDKDIYQVQLTLPSLTDTFHYKYFTRRPGGERRWEKGSNRLADPSAMPRGQLVWDDRWERIALEFSIHYDGSDPLHDVMHITGDPPQIGAWFKPGPVPMTLGPEQMLETDVKGRKWLLKVWVERMPSDFSYRYILVNARTKAELWEREPNRHAEFHFNRPIPIADAALQNGTRTPTQQNGGKAKNEDEKEVEIEIVNSLIELKDVNFVSKMQYDAVPDNMFIGPYPQTEDDIKVLAEGGVTAVLNVQTDEDFQHRGIQWDKLTKAYKEHGIKIVRFQIRDFDRDSLKKHIKAAAHVLDDLINVDGKDVYIHCTAGMGRAPAVAVAYLCWVKGYELMDAVKHVKKYRTVAVPNVPVLEQVLKEPY